jgi:hypothetical protein
MIRRSLMAGAFAFAMAATQGTWANAQWMYPGGYGGWGWGGWGASTAGGDFARGLGVYAMGAGYYNEQTAIANSINTDTVMRWNQYVYESQKEANRLHHLKLAQDRQATNQALDQIRERLRNNPERRDIYRGDAMNVALDEINDPRVYAKALEGGKVKIGAPTIRNIPFQYAAAAITISIHQIAKNPPAVLLTPEFEAERTAFRELAQEVRGQIAEDKQPDPESIRKLLDLINKAEAHVDRALPAGSRERTEADKYLKALHGLIAMLQTPAIDVLVAGVQNRPEATLGDLLGFMNAFNLRFGAASTPQQRMAYDTLYPRLVELRNQVAPALATAAATTPTGSEAHDFFQGMSYQDLQKKAPAPPAPTPKP